MLFWEFPAETQDLLVSVHLSKWGEVVGRLETPESFVFTLRSGDNVLVAKAPKVDAAMSPDKLRERLTVFLHEANHIYRVCHMSLVQRFAYAEVVHGLPFLIAAKRHQTLRDAMEEGPLSEIDALAIGVQIAHALAYLRARGVVCHQDLKPENVFLDDIRKKFAGAEEHPFGFQTYLADFDLANAAVLFNQRHGSRPYMAPEQYDRGPSPSGTRLDAMDIFALGVNLYEMLTGGIHPLGVRTNDAWPNGAGKWKREDTWKKWARTPTLSPSGIDPSLGTIIADCLNVAPELRPSAHELEDALFAQLRRRSVPAASSLEAYLKMADDAAALGEEAGWPHMDDMIRRLSVIAE